MRNSLTARIARRPELARHAPKADGARWRLGRHEVLAIVGFWTLFAVLTTANRLLGDLGPAEGLGAVYVALYWVLNSYLWAAVTPLVFWLAWRFGTERSSRVSSALLLFVVGMLIVTAMMFARGFVWRQVLNLPPLTSGSESWSLLGILLRPWFLNDLVTYAGVLAVGLAREYFVRHRVRQEETVRLQAQAARLQAQLADARIEALRTQLNPHFLFNTLHAISSLVERDPRGVRRMIARLSELLRYALQGASKQEVSVEEEMRFLQKYLDIMQVRFQGRLEIETRVAPEVLDALVPNLILQPLVENAVKHGVSNCVGTGRIEIYASRKGNRLVLGVRDNGPGFQPDGESDEREGVGLPNVRSRLQQLFGGDQVLSLRTAEGGGVLAVIELPLHTRADLRVGDVALAEAQEPHDL